MENLSFVHREFVHNDLIQKALLLRRSRPCLDLFNQLLDLRAYWSVVEFLLQIMHAATLATPIARTVVADAVARDQFRVALCSHSIQLVCFSHLNADDCRFGSQSSVARGSNVFCDESIQENEFNL